VCVYVCMCVCVDRVRGLEVDVKVCGGIGLVYGGMRRYGGMRYEVCGRIRGIRGI
jgi:hypothetical protein